MTSSSRFFKFQSTRRSWADLRAVLPAAIVNHGDGTPPPVLDAWNLLLVEEAGLVSVQLAEQHKREGSRGLATSRAES